VFLLRTDASVLTVFTSHDVKRIMSDGATLSTDERGAIDSLSDELAATVETAQDKAAARYIHTV
jgi:hypothetical protein